MTSMLQKVSKDEVNVERYDKKSTTNVDIRRSLFHWQTHAKIPDNVVKDGYFHNLLWQLNKRYICPSKAITAFKTGLQGILGNLEMWQKNAEMAIFTIFVEQMLKRPFL